MRQQSCCTVPKATWDYLLENAPYQDTRHIQYTLKRARHLKRKCYDSLPFLTAALCPLIKVPSLTQQEKHQALQLFKTIDGAIREGPFVSYLFCLEYILKKMGRQDLCEFINRIQCNKRRAAYTTKLNDIFAAGSRDIKSLLRTEPLHPQVLGDATFRPHAPAVLQVALHSGHVPRGSNVPHPKALWKVRLDEDLVVQELGRTLPLDLLEPYVVYAGNAGGTSS